MLYVLGFLDFLTQYHSFEGLKINYEISEEEALEEIVEPSTESGRSFLSIAGPGFVGIGGFRGFTSLNRFLSSGNLKRGVPPPGGGGGEPTAVMQKNINI